MLFNIIYYNVKKEIKMDKNLYFITKKLIEMSEISLSGAKFFSTTNIVRFFSYEFDVRLPMGYILIGFKDFFLPYCKAILLCFLLAIILLVSSFIFEIKNSIYMQFFLLFLITIAFALPSRYAYYSTTDESVNKVIKVLNLLKINDINNLESIEKNINFIYLRVKERIKVLQWAINISWIVFIILSTQLRALFEMSNLDEKGIIGLLEFFLIKNQVMIYFLLPIILVSIYKRGMNYLFLSILFAINDYKKQILKNVKKPLQKTFLKLN